MSAATYRAVQALGGGRLELVERPLPRPGPGQVLLTVEACGICHTDALTVEGGFPGLEYPRVPGHEVVGHIAAVGERVAARWKVGQRVGVGFLSGRCGECESCRRGDFVNCASQPLTGIHFDGGYAEAMIADQHGLVAIPEEFSAVDAAPLLCAGVTTFNALRKSPARQGDLVVIQGIGGLGHLGIQFARHMGYRTVAIARGAGKKAMALELGAHHYIDSAAEDPAKALQALGGASVIVATASSPASMGPLLGGLKSQGRLVIVGAGAEPLQVPVTELLFGERSISGSNTGSPVEAEDMLNFSLLRDIRARIETLPLARAAEGYAKMMRNEARFRMVLTTGVK
ncbi:alcohol dehydrogenase [Cystobacter fuscus]|uniref:alcohol dehydrogenase n=1 Tax=Cystobacter fuscus TaxID=43 RepID=UPI000BB3A021|nr:alcohol dehydrogenase [Cystobacter fuscus]